MAHVLGHEAHANEPEGVHESALVPLQRYGDKVRPMVLRVLDAQSRRHGTAAHSVSEHAEKDVGVASSS